MWDVQLHYMQVEDMHDCTCIEERAILKTIELGTIDKNP